MVTAISPVKSRPIASTISSGKAWWRTRQRPSSTPAWKRTPARWAARVSSSPAPLPSAIGEVLQRQIHHQQVLAGGNEAADRRLTGERLICAREDEIGPCRRGGVEVEALLRHRPL